MRPYRLAAACLAWFTVLSQYGINIAQQGFVAGSITYFGFFTILGNYQVALALAAPLLPECAPRRFFLRPGVRTAIAVYILVIAVIFFLLLRSVYHPTGFGYYINILLHYVMPPVYLLDWVLFVPKRRLTFRQALYWTIFPLLYAAYVLLHGAASGYYPYPFLDVGSYGYAQVFLNIGGFTVMFLVLFAVFIALGRVLPEPAERA